MTQRARVGRVAQLALVALVIAFAVRYLRGQWMQASDDGVRFEFNAGWLGLASLLTLATFCLLIETWRRVLVHLGSTVPFELAARIWFVSNLGKYVPGRIWQVATMAVMAGERGVPVATVGASAVLMAIASVATGFAVVLVTSAGTVQQLAGGVAGVVVATVGLFLLLVGAPWIASHWNRVARRFPRAQLSVAIPPAAIAVAIAGCAISWLLYGLAFMLFVWALIGQVGAPYSAFVTANAASYLVGYLAIIAPAGIGFREVVLASILVPLRIATAPQAAVITIASRIWLTVLEILPSLVALIQTRGRRIP